MPSRCQSHTGLLSGLVVVTRLRSSSGQMISPLPFLIFRNHRISGLKKHTGIPVSPLYFSAEKGRSRDSCLIPNPS